MRPGLRGGRSAGRGTAPPPRPPPWRSVGHRCAPTSRGHRLPGVRAAVAWPGGAAPHPTVPSSPDSSGGSARSWVLDCRRRHAPSCRTRVPQGRGVCREFWRVSWAGRQGFSDPFQGTLSHSGQHGGQSSPGSGFPRSRERPGKVGGAGSLPVLSGARTHLLWPLPFGLLPSAGAYGSKFWTSTWELERWHRRECPLWRLALETPGPNSSAATDVRETAHRRHARQCDRSRGLQARRSPPERVCSHGTVAHGAAQSAGHAPSMERELQAHRQQTQEEGTCLLTGPSTRGRQGRPREPACPACAPWESLEG